MSNHTYAPCAAEDLEVRLLSDHEWRVGDRRRDEQSPENVLGYIEQRGSAFKALNIEAPHRHVMFDRLESAVASFTACTYYSIIGQTCPRECIRLESVISLGQSLGDI
jgi:hypothetical protein